MSFDLESRFSLIEGAPPLFPSKCMICESASGKTYIDFKYKLVRYGRIYLCTECFGEIADGVGWIGPVNSEKMSDELATLKAENLRLKGDNAKLLDLVTDRIFEFRSDLFTLLAKPEAPKRAVGRPKKTADGTS